MGGSSTDVASSIAVDAFGNVYTGGWFLGPADFDPGAAIYNLNATGTYDIFISKLDSSGNLLWAKAVGDIQEDKCYSIAVDPIGNVYSTGSFNGPTDFDPGPATYNLLGKGGGDIFISKLDPLGNFVWAKEIGGAGMEDASAIAVDGSDNVYITGVFTDTADFDPGPGVFTMNTTAPSTNFISKLDASGHFGWAKQMVGSYTFSVAYGGSVDVDQYGNVYTTGNFVGTIDFDPNAGTYNLTATGPGDIFVLKLSPHATGIENLETPGVSLYPNPIKDFVTIVPNGEYRYKVIRLSLVDAMGRQVFQQDFNQGEQIRINVGYLSPGFYGYRLSYDEGVYYTKGNFIRK